MPHQHTPTDPPALIDAWADDDGAARARAAFSSSFDERPDGVWYAPGRVNLIGEHTDYNGGLALPIALPHRTFAAFRRRDDGVIRLVSGRESTPWEGTLDGVAPGSVPGWPSYVAGVAWALAQAGQPITGFDAAIESCVPYGSGLSSSAALEGSVAMALADRADHWVGPDASSDAGRAAIAAACVRAENEIAGANTGGMDQAASLRAQAGHALLLDCLDGSIEQEPFDLAAAGLELLVIDTRAPHAHADGEYSQRRATCEAAAAHLGVGTLREITPEDLDAALERLDKVSGARVRHVVTEIARVGEFVELLRAGRLRDVGPLMDASHTSLRDDYEVSCTELDVTVAAARDAGALGARMTGGGFGGSAIALVEAGSVPEVSTAVAHAFEAQGLGTPTFLVATASGPAGRAA